MALYLQAATLLECMVTDPWKEGYCILTPSLANLTPLHSSFVRSQKTEAVMHDFEYILNLQLYF